MDQTSAALAPPIFYSPYLEIPEKNEQELSADILAHLHQIAETVADGTGHAERDVHAKTHGILQGTLIVANDLTPEFAQGMFSSSGSYPVVMRFTTPPGDKLSDEVSVPRGLALKVIGVSGERLPQGTGKNTQDFLMVNGPVFQRPGLAGFAADLKLLTPTANRGEGAKKAVSAAMRGAEKLLEAVGLESGKLKSMGGHPQTNLLGEKYFTQTAFRYGDYVAKFALMPASENLKVLEKKKLDNPDHSDALREELNAFFEEQSAEWLLMAQLNRDVEKMPIEDPSVQWLEELSPYVTVARLILGPQKPWKAEATLQEDSPLFFNPWQGLAAHQPLGRINRVRAEAYARSSEFRSSRNRCPIREPS